MKQLHGGAILYFCEGHTKVFSNFEECLAYAQYNCFNVRYSCSLVGQSES